MFRSLDDRKGANFHRSGGKEYARRVAEIENFFLGQDTVLRGATPLLGRFGDRESA